MDAFEIIRAFAEGMLLIASPCILPVLPLVLSASVDGGKKRPFGIIAGFVISFSAFVLLSRFLVEALHIDPTLLRTGSLWLLFALGLVLISPRLSELFSRVTRGAAALGNRIPQTAEGGFLSGVAIGSLIGLVWTPCAGPILAIVLVQVIQQQTTLEAVAVVVSFAAGAGLPMLAISLLGRNLMGKLPNLAKHAEDMRRAFGVIVILSVGYIAFSADIGSWLSGNNIAATEAETETNPSPLRLENGLMQPYSAPAFTGLQKWFNSSPLTMADLKGKVVLVDFWTYSCVNCVRTLPYLTAWDKKYRKQGLVIVGVHSPEFEFEKSPENVRAAILNRGIKYPVALDNDFATWKSFRNKYWPAHYLINRKGQVVYIHFGEGKYDVTENNIRYLLGLDEAPAVPAPKGNNTPSSEGQTPEVYLGYTREEGYVGEPEMQRDVSATYQAAETLEPSKWTLHGGWRVESEKDVAVDDNATLRLNFTARKVFLVMGTTDGKPAKVSLKLDGVPVSKKNAGKHVKDSTVIVKQHTLYELLSLPEAKSGVLEIMSLQPGLEVYAFTFGG